MVAKPKAMKSSVAKPMATKMAAPAVAKSSAPVPAVARTTPAAGPATPAPTARPVGSANGAALKKKDLIDSVVQITGGKKKAVRDVVEATLKVLGDALSKGDMLNLPPFGKAKVSRQHDTDSGKPMTVKLRRTTAVRKPKDGLADAED